MIDTISLDFEPQDAINAISARLSLPFPESRAFEVVNCVRIATAYYQHRQCQCLDVELLDKLESIARRVGTDHPYEQWLKRLGILLPQCGEFLRADSCFTAAKAICMRHDFTMHTIGSSVELLQIIVAHTKGAGKNYSSH